AHEADLTAYALDRLRQVPGVRVYGPTAPARRLGVISFNVDGVPHGLVAAILSREWGIGTRSGCFCAQSYVKALLGVSDAEWLALEERVREGDRSRMPGAVRVSFGLYNTTDEIDRLGHALEAVAAGRYATDYRPDPVRGEYVCPESVVEFGH